MPLLRLFLLSALILTTTSCALFSGRETVNLPELADRFCEAMRWQDFQGAALYLEPDHRAAFLDQFPEDRDLKVVDSRIQSARLELVDGVAEAVYLLEYYRLPSTRIDRWTWVQQWRRHPSPLGKEAVWMISNPPPPLPWNH